MGHAWSASKSKRNSFKISNNPGPADYDVKFDFKCVNHQDEEYREMARLFTFLPRYIEAKQLETISEVSTNTCMYKLSLLSETLY